MPISENQTNTPPSTTSFCSISGVYEAPRTGIGGHPDAKNMDSVMLTPRHLTIRSTRTGAQLTIHKRTNGEWFVEFKLSWPGIGHEVGERIFTSAQLRQAFELEGTDHSLAYARGLFRRENDHLTIPPYVGEIHDGVPCISIRLSSKIKDAVCQLLEDVIAD